MLGLSPEIILRQNYGTAKGYFAENFVACLLKSAHDNHKNQNGPFSWNNKNHEIEFIINIDENLVPIQVQSKAKVSHYPLYATEAILRG
ncbi:MAG: DUF4143 domain-containing protein [Oligoflexia bacterium]|nr:DUF4143 domain-containing protein [Oligoflexia bacterium]